MTDTPRTPYEALGERGIRELVDRFYDRMSDDPRAATIRAMHAADLTPMREKLTVFLVGWMGGPSEYTARFGPVNVPSAHAPFDIGPEERDAWLACMRDALDASPLPAEFRPKMDVLFERMAEMCRTVEADGTVRPTFASIRETMSGA